MGPLSWLIRVGIVTLISGLTGVAWAIPPVLGQLILTVRETAGIARSGEVVRSGVPIPHDRRHLHDSGDYHQHGQCVGG